MNSFLAHPLDSGAHSAVGHCVHPLVPTPSAQSPKALPRLTDRQAEALDFICEHIETRGCAPTYREIGVRMGIGSTNGINEHIRALARKGYIVADDAGRGSRSRSIVVLRRSDGVAVRLRLVPVSEYESPMPTRKTKRKPTPKLTGKAAQRVAIARDVIARVKAGQISPCTGLYLEAENVVGAVEAKEALASAQCTACAIGGLLFATVLKHDKVSLRALGVPFGKTEFAGESEGMRQYLHGWFSTKQLSWIESAFEGPAYSPIPINAVDNRACERFFEEIEDDSDRLVAIMRNIIRNGGTFVMPKRIVAAAKRQLAAEA